MGAEESPGAYESHYTLSRKENDARYNSGRHCSAPDRVSFYRFAPRRLFVDGILTDLLRADLD